MFSPVAIGSFPQVVEMADGGTTGVTMETLPGKRKGVRIKVKLSVSNLPLFLGCMCTPIMSDYTQNSLR